MLWAGVLLTYRSERQQEYREVERRNQNYARLFEENVLRSIGEMDKALLYLRRTVEAAKDTTDYQTIVLTNDVLSEIIVQVAIIDAKGIARGSNALPVMTQVIDISDREHFRVHVGTDEDKLFISKPLVGRASGKWSVQFTRRFSNKDGSLAGVVVASMDPAHFTNFYDTIDLGSTTSVAMIGSDGVVRSSGGGEVARLPLGQDLSGTPLFIRLHGGSSAVFKEIGLSSPEPLVVTARKVRGHPLWVTVSTREAAIYDAAWSGLKQNTTIVVFLTILILIALEHILRAEEKAAQKAEQLDLTLEHISQGIMLITKDRQIPIINKRCVDLLRLPDDMIATSPTLDDIARYAESADARSARRAQIPCFSMAIAAQVPHEPSILDYERADGVFIEVRQTALPDGGCVQTFTDITIRRQAEAYIAQLASEDPLTKLHNRRVFRTRLQEVTDSCAGSELAVLFLDLDRFKVVNDTVGHRKGDQLLVKVAERLRSLVPSTGMLARLGGDEFAMLLPEIGSLAEVEAKAQSIIDALKQPFQVEHHLIGISISIGIAIGPRDGKSEDDLLVAADLALYDVKVSGRGTYRFYQPSMNASVTERRELELDLREAIEKCQLELYYQPIVDQTANKLAGFEALARWPHPTKGMISPGKFIPVAEDCGLIVPLGTWALMEACRTAVQWPDDLKISVNVSPTQLSSGDLVETVVHVLAETGLTAERLALEFTERIFIDESDRTLSTLHKLKQLGVQIALDDFGTGYSSLSYLRSFPFDTLKIDRSFIKDLGTGTSSNVIVQATILIAGGLGIRTVAEGVETKTQHEILKALGCDELQGYLFSPPVPLSKASALIGRWAGGKVFAA
jgi:diguanylate cyclase (GGDEF)-like protein